MIVRCIDFETTGLKNTDAIIEAGWCDVTWAPGTEATVGEPRAELIDPLRPIPPEARAVHHISDRMVQGKQSPSWVLHELVSGADAFCAHVIDFEQQFFGAGGMPWVCTHKCGLRLWPEAPEHNLQTLRYWLGVELDEKLATPPHRAGPDAYVGAHVLADVLRQAEFTGVTFDTLVRWSSGPALLVTCTLKKYRGVRWSAVPKDYLQWVVDNIKDDRDIRATAKYYLAGGKPLGTPQGPAAAPAAAPEQPLRPPATPPADARQPSERP